MLGLILLVAGCVVLYRFVRGPKHYAKIAAKAERQAEIHEAAGHPRRAMRRRAEARRYQARIAAKEDVREDA